MIKVTIADKTGHTELMVNEKELAGLLKKHSNSWIFVDGQLVNNVDINNVTEVNIMPPMVGGYA